MVPDWSYPIQRTLTVPADVAAVGDFDEDEVAAPDRGEPDSAAFEAPPWLAGARAQQEDCARGDHQPRWSGECAELVIPISGPASRLESAQIASIFTAETSNAGAITRLSQVIPEGTGPCQDFGDLRFGRSSTAAHTSR